MPSSSTLAWYKMLESWHLAPSIGQLTVPPLLLYMDYDLGYDDYYHGQGFDYAEEQNMAYKMSSFAETTALGYLKSQVPDKYFNNQYISIELSDFDCLNIYVYLCMPL